MSEKLNALYEQTINNQRDYLSNLQIKFNEKCKKIGTDAEEKIKAAGGAENATKANKQEIYTEQKSQLDEALTTLRQEVKSSSRKTRKKLEDIQTKREKTHIENLINLLA